MRELNINIILIKLTYNFETPFSCISVVSFIRNRDILNKVSG